MKINSQKIELMAAKKGMTKAALAVSMGVAPQNLFAICHRGSCTALTVVKIARALGCEPEEIIVRKED